MCSAVLIQSALSSTFSISDSKISKFRTPRKTELWRPLELEIPHFFTQINFGSMSSLIFIDAIVSLCPTEMQLAARVKKRSTGKRSLRLEKKRTEAEEENPRKKRKEEPKGKADTIEEKPSIFSKNKRKCKTIAVQNLTQKFSHTLELWAPSRYFTDMHTKQKFLTKIP